MPRKARIKPIESQPAVLTISVGTEMPEVSGEPIVISSVPTKAVVRLTAIYYHLNTVSTEREIHFIHWTFEDAKQMPAKERALAMAAEINRNGLKIEDEESKLTLWYPPERVFQMMLEHIQVPDEKAALLSK